MKKIYILVSAMTLGLIYLASKNPAALQAYQDVVAFSRLACSSTVTVSTTPAAITSCLTANRNEVRLRQYATDVVYVNYSLPASSTSAAATGVKMFQTAANNTYVSIPLSTDQTIYLTYAADSGTTSVNKEEFGHY